MSARKLTVKERLLSKVQVNPETGCWEWTARLFQGGYAQFKDSSDKNRGGHVVSYEIHIGPVPEGLVLDHLCRNRKCINPAHLEPVSQQINTLRGEGPAAKNAVKTHCLKGHPLDGSNLFISQGKRQCRECHLERGRAHYANNLESQRERSRITNKKYNK